MLILRATAKLIARAKPEFAPDPGESTGLLGDWYANLVYVERQQLILAVSAKTLLPIVLSAKEIRTLPTRLPAALGEVLAALEIPAPAIALELEHMKEHRYAKTASRVVLGVMNDYLRMLPFYADPGRSFLDVSVHLAETPMSPLRGKSPDHETQRLFGCTTLRRRSWAAAPERPRVLPFLSSLSTGLPLKGENDVEAGPASGAGQGAGSQITRADRERVAQKLLAAETNYYEALRRQRAENTDESREALATAERALKAIETWAAQVSREEVFH